MPSKRKSTRKVVPKSAEELDLEASLFGTLDQSDFPSIAPEPDSELAILQDDQLFATEDAPKAGSPAKSLWEDPSDAQLSISLANNKRARKLRSTDKEDIVSGSAYEAKLRQQHAKLNPVPAWATIARSNAQKRKRDDADDTDWLQSTHVGLKKALGREKSLLAGTIDIERLKDVAMVAGAKGSIASVEFHPTVNVVAMVSSDRRIRLHSVDGAANPQLQSLHVPELPLTHACFHPSGQSLLLTGNKPFFLSHDLTTGQTTRSPSNLLALSTSGSVSAGENTVYRFSPDGSKLAMSGKRGYIHLLDWRSGQNVSHAGDLKSNHTIIQDLCWNANTHELLSIAANAEVCVWDVRAMRCRARWIDQGGFASNGLVSDQAGRFLATATKTGVVNVYDSAVASAESAGGVPAERRPIKTILNLTTSINCMRFNANAEILAISSDERKDALKLVHVPSMSVFSNWPTSNTPLGYVRDFSFSHDGQYLAIANDKGSSALLYHFPHYRPS